MDLIRKHFEFQNVSIVLRNVFNWIYEENEKLQHCGLPACQVSLRVLLLFCAIDMNYQKPVSQTEIVKSFARLSRRIIHSTSFNFVVGKATRYIYLL